MPGGRPLKFKSVEELEEKIKAYFDKCDQTVIKTIYDKEGNVLEELTKPYTITGLALALDTSRETLCNYEEKEEYFDTIKRAKLKCQNDLEERAITGKANPTFSIFSMKNNYGWRDKTEIEHSGEMTIGSLLDKLKDGHNPESKQ